MLSERRIESKKAPTRARISLPPRGTVHSSGSPRFAQGFERGLLVLAQPLDAEFRVEAARSAKAVLASSMSPFLRLLRFDRPPRFPIYKSSWFSLNCAMPTVLRIGALRVAIYPNDHPPPHVHVTGAKGEAVF
jgi:hypothetical protein